MHTQAICWLEYAVHNPELTHVVNCQRALLNDEGASENVLESGFLRNHGLHCFPHISNLRQALVVDGTGLGEEFVFGFGQVVEAAPRSRFLRLVCGKLRGW